AAYESVTSRPAQGGFERDIPFIAQATRRLVGEVAAHGPDQLRAEASDILEHDIASTEQLLRTYWHEPSDRVFFAEAMLQPYAQWLAESGRTTSGRGFAPTDNRCPFCG